MLRAVALIAFLLVATTVAAATEPPTPSRDRARTYLMLRVVDALDLSDEKALQMRDILKRADDRRLELTQKRDKLDSKLRAALAKTPVDAPALGQLVTDSHAVQRELASLPEHTFSEAQKILTVEQQAKLLLFRRDLQGEVRQAIRRRSTTPTTTAHHATPAR
jgi:hypothetical protein